MKRILIVGSGDGGTFTSNLLVAGLKEEISKGSVSVQLVGERLEHPFQPGNLDVAFKGAQPDGFVRDETELLRKGVEFVQDAAINIDLKGKAVTLASGRKVSYDYLVIATGAVADPSMVPGLAKGSLNFHTGPKNASKIWEALQTFERGTIAVLIAGTPHKCPPSPDEAAFMLDGYFRERGIRDRVKIRFLTPYPRPYPAERISHVVERLFESKGVEVTTFFNVDSVDPVLRKVYSLEGEEVDYDLLVAIPPHHGAQVITESGIGDQDGYVPTDKGTMQVKGAEGVYAIGDATDIPVSKSGVVAHLQSVVVARNIISAVRGSTEMVEYNGRINCPMEVGKRRAIFVSATYESPPKDQEPSIVKYVMKRSFAMIYWRALGGRLEWMFDLFFGETRTPVKGPQAQLLTVARPPEVKR